MDHRTLAERTYDDLKSGAIYVPVEPTAPAVQPHDILDWADRALYAERLARGDRDEAPNRPADITAWIEQHLADGQQPADDAQVEREIAEWCDRVIAEHLGRPAITFERHETWSEWECGEIALTHDYGAHIAASGPFGLYILDRDMPGPVTFDTLTSLARDLAALLADERVQAALGKGE